MSKPYVRWLSEDVWVCEKHLPSVRMHRSDGRCAFPNCDSVRPRRESFKKVVKVSTNVDAQKARPSTTAEKKATKKTSLKTEVASSSVQVSESNVAKCAWFKCTKGPNGGPADSRPRSKYCSRACSNSSARYRHKIRAKAKKDD